ncbi:MULTISPECIES: SigB/SigF/SigG family RNA polymerase sigma factor [unclassified Streptomyces]|uniref:SigB/SigF/SigG family RNA polymerase sigma factor n=1 Tax=Streptomyces sp. NBC_00060 TaxID=2975636 RepID=A0AAU2H8Q1_9ACTN
MPTARQDTIRTEPPPVAPAATVRSRALDGIPEVARPQALSTDDARSLSETMFRRLAELDEGTPEHAYVRNTLVELNLSLVRFAARRFRDRAEPMEDIVQVGTIGLIKAINRFDVERGVEFSSFALPTITGEMKRFFRDTSWAVQVPRRLQELRLRLAGALEVLGQELGRPPTTAELAVHLGVTEAEVVEGEQAANGYMARSLDIPDDDTGAAAGLMRRLGEEEGAFDVVDSLESLKPLIAGLTDRERTLLSLRFGEELTQAEIGARVGLSQMHVSRLLAQILERLREGLLEDGPEAVTAE